MSRFLSGLEKFLIGFLYYVGKIVLSVFLLHKWNENMRNSLVKIKLTQKFRPSPHLFHQ